MRLKNFIRPVDDTGIRERQRTMCYFEDIFEDFFNIM